MQNTETWGESVAHRRSAAYLHVPPEEPAYQDGMGSPVLFPYQNTCDCRQGKGQAWHIFNIFPGSSARFASCKLHSHGNWFTAPYRSRKLLKTLLLFFFVCLFVCFVLFFLLSEYTDFFFCLNALWSKGAVLLAYEVWDMCCSWHCVWTAVTWQGNTTYMKYM